MSAQAPPQGYPSHTQAQPSYPHQHQVPYGPTTPVTPTSAQSPTQQQYLQQQWQQYYQWHGQLSQQGNNGQQQTPPQQRPQYSATPTPTTELLNHYQQPLQFSPPASQQGHHPHMYQPQPSRAPSVSAIPVQNSQQQLGGPPDVVTGGPSPQDYQTSYDEIEEDDLESLSIPDLPPSPSTFASVQISNAVMAPPIKLNGAPLPANSVVADTLDPIAPPAIDGRCRSKYVSSADIDEEHEHSEYSKYMHDHQSDPIFAERPSDESTMSVEDAFAIIRQLRVDGELREGPSKSRSPSRSTSVRRESVDKAAALVNIEQNIAAEKAKLAARLAEIERRKELQNGKHASPSQTAAGSPSSDRPVIFKKEQQSPMLSSTFKKPMITDQQVEVVLAALGVTGTPKPVDTRPLPPYLGESQRIPAENFNPADSGPNDQSSSGSTPRPQGHGPHPASLRQSSYLGGADGSPHAAASNDVNAHSYNANGTQHDNAHSNDTTQEYNQSPNDSRLATLGSRKRSFAHRGSSSDDEDTPARRQEDDVTPKLKRRQPKVAEAYG
ncbi:hypothetical protein P7C71_g1923, partial [Lecanoromycetidae sp. Uapishka_2]